MRLQSGNIKGAVVKWNFMFDMKIGFCCAPAILLLIRDPQPSEEWRDSSTSGNSNYLRDIRDQIKGEINARNLANALKQFFSEFILIIKLNVKIKLKIKLSL
jgi:hypothetical protein